MDKLRLIILSLIVFGGSASDVMSQEFKLGTTAAEISMLPRYCQDWFIQNKNGLRQWAQTLGKETNAHLGHHCNGLLFFNRATMEFQNQSERRRLAKRAARESNYVLKRWPMSSPLYQEALANKMRSESLASQ